MDYHLSRGDIMTIGNQIEEELRAEGYDQLVTPEFAPLADFLDRVAHSRPDDLFRREDGARC